MQRGRTSNRAPKAGRRNPSTGLPMAGKLTLRQRIVQLALRRANKGAHVVHKYPGRK